jgi:hypothetical protein
MVSYFGIWKVFPFTLCFYLLQVLLYIGMNRIWSELIHLSVWLIVNQTLIIYIGLLHLFVGLTFWPPSCLFSNVNIGPKLKENNRASEERFKVHPFFLGAAADLSWLSCVQLLYLLVVNGLGTAHICQAVVNMNVGWYGVGGVIYHWGGGHKLSHYKLGSTVLQLHWFYT